ncbi:hypothetical protein SAMN05421720_11368 [Rhodospira trueperi]|uniref:Uncharacterized protein n=2 Tax=Rhodospira trueperi TaxID=69960 RepID=A0A1G7G3K1_9PROT|nr:hypothetical protein SAMN05421720_11368 [Rhodospira trueperi]
MIDGMAATEVAGGVLGLLGSIVLAIPALMDLNNRRFWDQLHRLNAIKGASNDDVEALRRLLLDDLLGGHRLHARCTVGGGALLAVAFLCLAAAGTARLIAG